MDTVNHNLSDLVRTICHGGLTAVKSDLFPEPTRTWQLETVGQGSQQASWERKNESQRRRSVLYPGNSHVKQVLKDRTVQIPTSEEEILSANRGRPRTCTAVGRLKVTLRGAAPVRCGCRSGCTRRRCTLAPPGEYRWRRYTTNAVCEMSPDARRKFRQREWQACTALNVWRAACRQYQYNEGQSSSNYVFMY